MTRILIGAQVLVEIGEDEHQLGPLQAACALVVSDAGEEGVPRDRLIELLWGEVASQKQRGRLRQMLYELNQKVGATVLRGEGGNVVLGEGVEVEVRDSASRVAVRVRTAELEHWLDGFRDRMVRIRSNSRQARCILARTSDQPAEVIRLTEDSTDDELRHHRLWALFRLGRIAEARKLAADLTPGDITSDPSVSEHVGPTPLVGRAPQLEQATRIVRGRTPLVLIGRSGIGKSRLLDALAAHLCALDPETVLLRADGLSLSTNAAFGGLGRLFAGSSDLQGALGEVDPSARALLLGNDEGLAVTPSFQMHAVALAFQEVVRVAFGSIPILIAFDDIHLVDRTSQEVLLTLPTAEAVEATVLTTSRARLATSNPRIGYLPVPRLDSGESVSLLRHIRPGLGDDELHALAAVGEGVPAALETLATTVEKGSAASATVSSAVEAALAVMRPEVRDLLGLLSVHEAGLPVDMLTGLLGRSHAWVVRRLGELQASGLVVLTQNAVRLPSRLLFEHLRADLDPTLVRSTSSYSARWLEERGEDPSVVGAFWELAEDRERAASCFRVAAIQADERGAFHDAFTFASKGFPDGGTDRESREVFGRIAVKAGEYSAAARALGSVAGHDTDSGRSATIGLVASLIRTSAGDPTSVVLKALDGFRSSPDQLAELIDLGIVAAEFRVDWDAMERMHRELCRYLSDHSDRWRSHWLGARLVHLGRRDEGIEHARLALESVETREPTKVAAARHRLIACLSFCGEMPRDESLALLEIDAAAASARSIHTRFSLLANRAVAFAHAREFRASLEALEAAEKVFGGLPTDELLHLEINRLEALVGLKAWDGVRSGLSRIRAMMPSPREVDYVLCDSAEALLHAANGDLPAAERLVDKGAWLDLSFPFASDLSLVLLARSEVWQACKRTERLRQELEDLRGSPGLASRGFRELYHRTQDELA